MVTGKRALIVDDSRSARVILSRMLEQHGMAVDTAESAEQALEYLGQNRPDVIFMDHLMPGMDGFQAVQAIKSDSQTATIPLMMYTSQEGELYVSQARALGAVGVLPKTVRPVDVSRVLYQLHLLPDRRQNRTALFEREQREGAIIGVAEELATGAHAAVSTVSVAAGGGGGGTGTWNQPLALSELQGGLRQSVQQLLKDQLAEQRRFMLATFEAFARRMGNDIKEQVARIPAPMAVEPIAPEPTSQRWWPVVLTALFAALPALVLGALFSRATDTNRALVERLGTLEKQQVQLEAATRAAAAASSDALASVAAQPAGPLAVEYVPYGETPLAGARLERLRTLAGTLEAEGFRGRIVAESFVGDFCLDGTSVSDGFTVAPPATLLQKCVLMGNPFDDSLSPAQRQSVAFANFVATLRQRTGGAIAVEVANGGRTSPIEYPEQREDTTAGEWNRIAALNNRVEFRTDAAAALARESAPSAVR